MNSPAAFFRKVVVFLCQKCQHEINIEDIFELTRCDHKICRRCARRFLLDWATLKCPLVETCKAEMTLEDAALVLDEQELEPFILQSKKQLENEENLLSYEDFIVKEAKPEVGEGQFLCDLCTMASPFETLFQVSSECDHILCHFCAQNYVNDPENAHIFSKLCCPIIGCRGIIDALNAASILDPNSATFECPLCAETIKQSDTFCLGNSCCHQFCRDCARRYLKSLIEDRKPLKCPIGGCDEDFEICDAQLVLDDQDLEKLCEILLEISVADCVHCPKPNCRGIAEVVPPRRNFVCPECKYDMCVRCRRDWHASVTCEDYAKWLVENGQADAKFDEYAANNQLQVCPKCRNGVERTEGCNHMHCRCGTDFCYKCGQMGKLSNGQVVHNCREWVWRGH